MIFQKFLFIKDKNTFKNLSKLGLKLINLHLLKDSELNSSISEALFKNAKNKNFKIKKSNTTKTKKNFLSMKICILAMLALKFMNLK